MELWRKLKTGDRKTVVTTVVIVAVLVALGIVGLEATMKPAFCGSCHSMKLYYAEWKDSGHGKADVACVDCHINPGLGSLVKRKVGAAKELISELTGTAPTRPRSHVDDVACLRPGCHTVEKIGKELAAFDGSVKFDHGKHLNGAAPFAKLHCTTCHAQTEYGSHMSVNGYVCVLCHRLRESGAVDVLAREACEKCHQVPDKEITIAGTEQTFDHSTYSGEGVRCAHCHSDVYRGEGRVAEDACLGCHKSEKYLEGRKNIEALHIQHIVTKKVECDQCHQAIEHSAIAEMPELAKTVCTGCHRTSHQASAMLLFGKGGKGIDGTMPAKAVAGVDCIGCHRHAVDVAGGGMKARPDAEGCVACHGDGAQEYLATWKSDVAAATAKVAALLATAKKKGLTGPEVETAQHNYDLVRTGGGVHNPDYAVGLMDHSAEVLSGALAGK